jgi:uncharacterized protein (TIGR01244 family)
VSDFRQLSEQVWASPQIDERDVRTAADRGFTLIINNRPEGESEDQVAGDVIERAAREAGLDYRAIPITHAGFSRTQVEEMESALGEAQGPVLAYCRSGTRSTLLWALAQAKAGVAPETVTQAASAAGYDVSPVRPVIDMFFAAAGR